eukprot:scaffold2157_cov376-Prasinococcus_capsulatus_cf.AAC.15
MQLGACPPPLHAAAGCSAAATPAAAPGPWRAPFAATTSPTLVHPRVAPRPRPRRRSRRALARETGVWLREGRLRATTPPPPAGSGLPPGAVEFGECPLRGPLKAPEGPSFLFVCLFAAAARRLASVGSRGAGGGGGVRLTRSSHQTRQRARLRGWARRGPSGRGRRPVLGPSRTGPGQGAAREEGAGLAGASGPPARRPCGRIGVDSCPRVLPTATCRSRPDVKVTS